MTTVLTQQLLVREISSKGLIQFDEADFKRKLSDHTGVQVDDIALDVTKSAGSSILVYKMNTRYKITR